MRITNQEARNILEIAGGFYDAAMQTGSWAGALARLNSLFVMAGVIFEQHDFVTGQFLEFESDGLPDQGLADWATHYHTICPRLAYIQKKTAGSITVDYQFIDEAGIEKHPLYQEFLGAYDSRYFLATTLEHDLERFSTISMQRTKRQGHASARDIELLQLLSPHLQRAFLLKRKLGLERKQVLDHQVAFQSLRMGVLIVDDTGVLDFINESAEAFLARDQNVRILGKQLVFSDAVARTHYNRARVALRDDAHGKLEPIAVLQDGLSHPLRFDFLPLPAMTQFARYLEVDQEPKKRLLILITDPAQTSQPPVQLLRDCYQLSAAEAKLALALSRGRTLRQHADEKEVTYTTVRTQLVSLRGKMGERDQAGVIRRVTRLVSPLDV